MHLTYVLDCTLCCTTTHTSTHIHTYTHAHTHVSWTLLAGLIDVATTQDVKDKLRHNTEEAIKLGAFGAPFIVVDDQIYFGSDRLEQMAFTHNLPWVGPDPHRAKAHM